MYVRPLYLHVVPTIVVMGGIRDCDCFTSHRIVKRFSMPVSMTAWFAVTELVVSKWRRCSSESNLYPLVFLFYDPG